MSDFVRREGWPATTQSTRGGEWEVEENSPAARRKTTQPP
jgi:hypothetical protein